jgi:putative flippase GtrA
MHRTSLARSIAAAAFATSADFTLVVVLVSGAQVAPALATGLGCAAGAAVNFLLSRVWAFASFGPLPGQVLRYSLVSASAMLLNSGGVGAAVLLPGFDYRIAWWLVRCLVFLLWNYPLHRHYVFR